LYLPTKNKSLTIYREKDNIDILIVDNANKVVIAIENKVYANERVDGEDGGQLKKYEDIVKSNYQNFDQYFVYLTIDLEDASRKDWFNASYFMIVDSITETMNSNIEINTKTKIILESYIDLLKRNGIVNDKDLKELCEKIWNNKKYADAMDILLEYRITPISIIFDRLKKEYDFEGRFINLDLTGIKELYKTFHQVWADADLVFEIQLGYFGGKDESIRLIYFYRDLEKQENKELTDICEAIIGKEITKKNKIQSDILIIDKSNIEDKTTDSVVKEIINKINGINEKIETIVKNRHKAVC
jgi:hypothetical protein